MEEEEILRAQLTNNRKSISKVWRVMKSVKKNVGLIDPLTFCVGLSFGTNVYFRIEAGIRTPVINITMATMMAISNNCEMAVHENKSIR